MSHRADPERVATRREAHLARIRSAGRTSDQAAALVRQAEQAALPRGLDLRDHTYWNAVASVVHQL